MDSCGHRRRLTNGEKSTVRWEDALTLIKLPPRLDGPARTATSRSAGAAQTGCLARFGNGRSTRAAIVIVEIVGHVGPGGRTQDGSTEVRARLVERGGGIGPLQVERGIDDMRVGTRDRAGLIGCVYA